MRQGYLNERAEDNCADGRVGTGGSASRHPGGAVVSAVPADPALRRGSVPAYTHQSKGAPMRRVYLDLCCLKRAFDDQSQDRVRREASAIALLIERAERGEIELVRSPAHWLENEANPREDRRLAAAEWLDGASVRVELAAGIEARAQELQTLGLGVLDALHVAFAEAAGTTWFVTCDDRLLAAAKRHGGSLRVSFSNPCDLPTEVGS